MLLVRTKGEQATVAIFHDKLTRVPWRVAQLARELHVSRCILGVKHVRIFDEQVRIEQLVGVFVGIGGGRRAQRK
jgi:hypothetical protein